MTAVQIIDRYPIEDRGAGIRITRDGYLTAMVPVARTGIQKYRAGELGLTDRAANDVVRVYRAEAEVFSHDSLRSMAFLPVTDDHPREAVNRDNWSRYAKGETTGEILRDGEYLVASIKVMDGPTIDKVRDGKRELSVGYSAEVAVIDGETENGDKYDAVFRNIRGNHLAIVDAARGGPALAIVDERIKGAPSVATKTIMYDGLPVEATDAAEAVIRKLESRVSETVAARDAAIADRDKAQGEVAALTVKLADATVTPVMLDALAVARAKTVADARKIAPDVVVDGRTESEIRKSAVVAKLGDAAAAMTDAAIEGAFAALVPVGDTARAVDKVADAVAGGGLKVEDAAAAYRAAREKRLAAMRGETTADKE